MKKFISSALALTLIASALAGCSSNTASTSDSGSAPESSTPSSQAESNTQAEQTNTEKALALIGTFASGDTDTARELLDENYIQHNLAYGTWGGCLYQLRGIPGVCRCKDHRGKHPFL